MYFRKHTITRQYTATRMRTIHLLSCFLLLFLPLHLQAAGGDTIKVSLRANAQPDKIQLRWAVNSPSAWYFTNKNGFTLLRYTIMRDSVVLETPEKTTLAHVLKPQPLDDWQHIAQKDNYAAIIAQALYGEDFQVSGGQSNISQIIALSQEQQQRYAMSLVAAEMSFPAAMFAGWGYEDYTVKKGERYLYQIVPLHTTSKQKVEIGASYISLSDYSEPPRPLDFNAVWGNGSVLLTWDYKNMLSYYNAYHLERSEDKQHFTRVSKTALTNIMGSDRMFYTDSISNGKTYYYRLQGVTTFGDLGSYSDILSGKGSGSLIYVPFIKQVMPDGTGGVEITWEFDERGNSEIKGFELRQSVSVDSAFTVAVANIPPVLRTLRYANPLPEGYLTVAAIPQEGEARESFPHLLQMEDSIPPAVPKGLKGYVDTLGVVHLNWDKNSEYDFYGYRIHRGHTKGEELIPLNDVAHQPNIFTDTVNIHNLNAKVYYAVASLDRRYNQSALSEVLELEKPDVVKPSPPYITRYESTEEGVRLEWVSGRDETIRSFRIYRREKGGGEAVRVAEITDTAAVSYTDASVVSGTNYIYYVKSATKSGLESDASPEIAVKSKAKDTGADITQFKGNRKSSGIVLTWQHNVENIRSVSIYRGEGEEALSLWQEADSSQRETADLTAKRNTAYEYMLVIKDKQGKVYSKNVNIK